MKSATTRKTAVIVIGAIWTLLGASVPGELQAAVARAGAGAEVIEPATLDFAGCLTAAAEQAKVAAVAGQTVYQVQAEVKLVIAEGGARLSIDYN